MRPDRKRELTRTLWRVTNRLMLPICGRLRWWVVLETTGRRTGQTRLTPLARGPWNGHEMWLIAVQGIHADYVRNALAKPQVRLRHRGVWHSGTATLHNFDRERVRRFNRYARLGPTTVGIDPLLLRVTLTPTSSGTR